MNFPNFRKGERSGTIVLLIILVVFMAIGGYFFPCLVETETTSLGSKIFAGLLGMMLGLNFWFLLLRVYKSDPFW